MTASASFYEKLMKNCVSVSASRKVSPGPKLRASASPQPSHLPALATREHELVSLIVAGNNDKQAAEALGISRHGVDATWRRIFKKLSVHSRIEAVLMVYGLRQYGNP